MNVVNDEFIPASRAMLVGAMLGGAASATAHLQARKSGLPSDQDDVAHIIKDTVKAGAVSGLTTLVASKMSRQPALSMLTIISAGVAGIYFLDHLAEERR